MKNTETLIKYFLIIIVSVIAVHAWLSVYSHVSKKYLAYASFVNGKKLVSDHGAMSKLLVAKASTHVYLNVPILMYHHVGKLPKNSDAIRVDSTVSPENFLEQVKWLKKNGYVTVSLDQVYKASVGEFVLPKKAVVLTFDDGYKDVFEYAFPVLRENGYIGSFAIITKFVGTSEYATWDDIDFAFENGMEIVSHTENHFDGGNRKFTDQYIYENLAGSRKDLKDHLGDASEILIYPYGSFTDSYITQAKKAGFKMGVTVRYGKKVETNRLFNVPRVRIHGQQSIERFVENIEK